MASVGNAVPTIEKLSTPQSEQMLIDMRSDGNSPNMKMPNPCAANTASTPSISNMCHPPG